MPAPLRVLLIVGHAGFLRNFESAIRSLAKRGHDITIAIARDQGRQPVVGERLAAEHDAVHLLTDVPLPSVAPPFGALASFCRTSLSYLHYLDARYDRFAGLRARAAHRAPAPLVWLMRWRWLRRRGVLGAIQAVFAFAERTVPVHPAAVAYLRRHRPDVLLVTPLMTSQPMLVDYVRAAARLRIPTCFCVASWDNLTTKGALHVQPDTMIVWNDAQRFEAWREVGFPPLRVLVAGAHAFDDWFHRQPRDRTSFCHSIGLPSDRPYVLYVCSSRSITEDERPVVDEWLRALRTSEDPRIRDVAVVVRPHPLHADVWREWSPAWDDVVVAPRSGEDPIAHEAKANYFDALSHSLAVVGLNTTALIEAGIAGRPVLSVIQPDAGQESAPHFHHLVDGGLLRTARTWSDHLRQLAEVIDAPGVIPAAHRQFLATFVRPYGVEWDAAPLFAAAVERTAADGPLSAPAPWRDGLMALTRIPLFPLAVAGATLMPLYRRWSRARDAKVAFAAPSDADEAREPFVLESRR